MIEVVKLQVFSLEVSYIDLMWEVLPTVEDLLDYTFVVERSESAAGPWDQLCEPFSDKFRFRDVTTKQLNLKRQHWYRLKTVGKGLTTYTDPVVRGAAEDLIAREARRHYALVLEQFTGRRAWILPVRTFGQKCPSCWDDMQGRSVRGNCPTCYSTGYARGYLAPMRVFAQFEPAPVGAETVVSLAFFPYVKAGDLIIEPENRRWRVSRVSQTERLRAPVKHTAFLAELQRSDIAFKIPIDEDLAELPTSEVRSFINPQCYDPGEDGLSLYGELWRGYE